MNDNTFIAIASKMPSISKEELVNLSILITKRELKRIDSQDCFYQDLEIAEIKHRMKKSSESNRLELKGYEECVFYYNVCSTEEDIYLLQFIAKDNIERMTMNEYDCVMDLIENKKSSLRTAKAI